MVDSLVTFELKEKYLLVTGQGRRDKLGTMMEAAALINNEASRTNSRLLLVDYRKLEITVRMTEAFNIVKRCEVVEPELKQITVAAVFDSSGLEFGQFWGELARQRGVKIEVLTDLEDAERWLLSLKQNDQK